MDEIKLLENQLKRMRSMNRFYHLQFLNDVRYFKKLDTREDLSDLISILKRRNSK